MATILLVDDEQLLLRAWALVLEGSGFHVMVASDGAETLELVRSTRPAIVVTDLNMPVLDGAGLCTAIRADESLNAIPLIVCTASDWSAPAGLCEGILRKPVDRDTLLQLIGSLLPGR
ncbi:response regulator receiver domain-containing protein [Cupriavidus sp. GA3-3]|uniref:response regulator n=1 Tax=Cupriavidus TaxID=106589 RepID=UPI00032E8071|nr:MULTISPECIES: response regulator [Cupriavidus]EON18875.1 response regulator receiver domain-containing protein [Cupriavidus sp. GA3-3]